jgi:hypothetical protein
MTAMVADDALGEASVPAPDYGIFSAGDGLPLDFTKKMLPTLQKVSIPEAGCFFMVEKPAEYNRTLLTYLETLPRPR